jgi:hypothetical protein
MKRNEIKISDLQASLNQSTFDSVTAKRCLNIAPNIGTDVTVEETHEFIQNYQQCSKKQKDDDDDDDDNDDDDDDGTFLKL